MNRNLGLIGVMVALVALLYATVTQLLPVVTGAPVAPLAAAERIKGEELDPDALKRLTASVRTAVGTQVTATSIALAPFGYVPPAPPAPVLRRTAPLMPLELSLVYESGDRRYARINGKLYQQGQTLPSGETLLQVTTDRIVVGRQTPTRQTATRQIAMDVSGCIASRSVARTTRRDCRARCCSACRSVRKSRSSQRPT